MAARLLTWDTTLGPGPLEQVQTLLHTADPTGLETPGLLADLRPYLPDDATWAMLRRHGTRQAVTLDEVAVPDAWAGVLASDAAADLAPGTSAVTIHATRHRTGTWIDGPARSDHPLTFTIFLTCPPPEGPCHTLRLSRPDQPLR